MPKARKSHVAPYVCRRGNVLWFRMAVPEQHRDEEGGKALIQESLHTTDTRVAAAMASKRRAQLFEKWGVLGDADIGAPRAVDGASIAVQIGFDNMLGRLMKWRQRWPDNDDEYAETLSKRRSELRRLMRSFNDGNLETWETIADRIVSKGNVDYVKGTDEYNQFVFDLAEANVDAFAMFIRQSEGEIGARPQSSVVQKVKAAALTKAAPGETIKELFEVYIAHAVGVKQKRPAGADQDRMVINQFAEFLGAARAVASIEYEDAKAFVDALAKVPAGYRKRRDYRGLKIRQAIEKAARDGHKTISIITQQRYISTVSPFFDWLRSERGGRRVRTNPFDGLHLDTKHLKNANPRPPFTAAQITKIIRSPLFTGFLEDGKEHLPGSKHADDWRKWIPLIALFTGARIGEVAQLHLVDFFRDHGIWCVELRHEEQSGQHQKSKTSRVVALHSTLIAMGLLQFVDRQKLRSAKNGNSQLFPEMLPGVRDQYGDMPSPWWRDYLGAIGITAPQGGEGFGSHSFRHTLSDQLRAAGHLDNVFGPLILGHSAKSVTGGYGEAKQGTPQLSQMLIESVKFVPIERGRVVEGGEPVDFAHLIKSAVE
jgi:integrase